MSKDPGQKFKNKLQAYTWLTGEAGYKVSRGKFYDDARAGKFRMYGGAYTEAALLKYAKDQGIVSSVTGMSSRSEEVSEHHVDKIKADTRVKDLTARKLAIQIANLEGSVMDKEAWRKELAARFVVLKSGLDSMTKRLADELTYLVGGDISKAYLVTERLQEEHGAMLNEYASVRKWLVIMNPDGE